MNAHMRRAAIGCRRFRIAPSRSPPVAGRGRRPTEDTGGCEAATTSRSACCFRRTRPRATRSSTSRSSRRRSPSSRAARARSSTPTPSRTRPRRAQQVDSMITNKVDVLIVDAVDSKAIAGAVQKAKDAGHPGRRLRPPGRGPDRRVRLLRQRGGRRASRARPCSRPWATRPTDGQIVMMNGAITDPNAALVQEGRALRPRRQGEHRQGVRHRRLEAGERRRQHGGRDLRPRRGQDRRRLLRQRRHGRRHHHRPQGRRHRPAARRSPVRTPSSPPCSGSSRASST